MVLYIFKNIVYLSIVVVYFSLSGEGRPRAQVLDKADQIFDAARQTVNDAAEAAQGVAGFAIDAAKGTVTNYINTIQGAAKLGVQTGSGIIQLGEDYVLGALNG